MVPKNPDDWYTCYEAKYVLEIQFSCVLQPNVIESNCVAVCQYPCHGTCAGLVGGNDIEKRRMTG